MAQYDWISSADFEIKIRTRLEHWLAEAKIDGYPYSTAIALAEIARENQPELEERHKRSLASARSIDDALESVDKIVRTAIASAQTGKRTTVTVEDMKASIQSNFCNVWPFCK
jgi:histone H3/H4